MAMKPPVTVMQLVLNLEIGGMEKLLYDLVEKMDKQLVSSTICCLDNKLGYFGEELRRLGYPVYTLQRKPGIDWTLIRELMAVIQQENVDVIHAQQYSPFFYAAMTSLYSKLPRSKPFPKLMYTVHGIAYPHQKRMKRMVANPLLNRFVQEIITISNDTKSKLAMYENFPIQRIRVIYNGIDFNRFSQKIDPAAKKQSLGVSSDCKVIGVVARLDPIKNHAMLLRAFQKIMQKMPETELFIVGNGPEEKPLKALAQSLNIMEKTHFLGMRNDVSELLHIFNVSVLPSFSEGMSVTLLEAMGAGVPVVATNVGGNPEVVIDQETGYLVPNDNEQEMTATLLRLLQDPETCQRIGNAGKQRAYARFTLEKMVQAYTDLYLKLGER